MHFKISHHRWRIHALVVLVIVISAFIIGRSFVLQVLRYPIYKALASDQRDFSETLIPQRGEIFIKDQDGELYPLAINRRFWKVYAVPTEVINPEEVALKLESLLDIPCEKIQARLAKVNDPYEPIKNKVSDEQAAKIEDLELEGIYTAPEDWRYYPEGDFVSHVLGFVGFKDEEKVGQYGIEEYYEERLAGENGFLEAERTGSGAWISVGLKNLEPARDGDDLVLTIDRTIQFLAKSQLEELVERFDAQGGTIIVMDPTSGAIKAMTSLPSFEPNEYFGVEDIDVFLNPATQKLFEPGSVFKPIVMAAGLDLGKITPQSTYEDKGVLYIDGYNIRNADEKIHGIRTMTQVLEESLNTGAVHVVGLLKKDEFYKYLKDFGLDIPTGVELTGEIGGDISPLTTNRDINYATASFGQGIAMTPLELLTAISTIANGGKMMKPHIIEKFIHPDGSQEEVVPKEVTQVISSQAAMKLTAMMVSVVRNGYGKKAGVEGYFVAGKTGTAQVPKEGKYSLDETIHSFAGFAPAFDPRFAILIKLDNPQGLRFSADSVAPTFSKMAKFLLNYYQIPPSE